MTWIRRVDRAALRRAVQHAHFRRGWNAQPDRDAIFGVHVRTAAECGPYRNGGNGEAASAICERGKGIGGEKKTTLNMRA